LKKVDNVQDPTFCGQEVRELHNRDKLVDAANIKEEAPRNLNLSKTGEKVGTSSSVVDPDPDTDPVGSEIICRIRNY